MSESMLLALNITISISRVTAKEKRGKRVVSYGGKSVYRCNMRHV